MNTQTRKAIPLFTLSVEVESAGGWDTLIEVEGGAAGTIVHMNGNEWVVPNDKLTDVDYLANEFDQCYVFEFKAIVGLLGKAARLI